MNWRAGSRHGDHGTRSDILADWARTDQLVRSLACVGRKDDALTELEALVKEGYNIGWRDMAVDPAYDGSGAILASRRSVTSSRPPTPLLATRFRARPDLNDADIESLGM